MTLLTSLLTKSKIKFYNAAIKHHFLPENTLEFITRSRILMKEIDRCLKTEKNYMPNFI